MTSATDSQLAAMIDSLKLRPFRVTLPRRPLIFEGHGRREGDPRPDTSIIYARTLADAMSTMNDSRGQRFASKDRGVKVEAITD